MGWPPDRQGRSASPRRSSLGRWVTIGRGSSGKCGFGRSGAILIVSLAVLCAACENTVPSEAERAEVEGAVTTYLHALAGAYSTLSIEPLEPVATGNEIEEVRKTLRGLAGTGDRVEARLLSVEFGGVDVFREVNATVTTTEVWEVTRFEAFTGRQKGFNPTSVQDSIIQLRLVDGDWLVSARRVVGQEAGPRWKVETPTPAGGDR